MVNIHLACSYDKRILPYLHKPLTPPDELWLIIISQIYCNYIYTSKELYDMEKREASDLEAVRAEKE